MLQKKEEVCVLGGESLANELYYTLSTTRECAAKKSIRSVWFGGSKFKSANITRLLNVMPIHHTQYQYRVGKGA